MEYNYLKRCDSIEEMKRMPASSVDLIITDPPYKTISGGQPRKKGAPSGMLSKNDGRIFRHNDVEPEEYMPEIYRLLKDGTQCYIFTNFINLENMMRTARETGFKLHNLLIWQKNNATPSRWYMKNAEYVLFMRKGKAKAINEPGSKTIQCANNIIGRKQHPTEKPTELLEKYIRNSSKPGDIVMDPFMGAGSTCIASRNTGRRYIGLEIDEQYFEIAEKRLKEL